MKVTIILSLLLFQLTFSQQKTCGTDFYMQQMMSDPVAKQKHLDLQKRFEIELAKLQNPKNEASRNANTTIFIPVAVHFPAVPYTSTYKECLKQLAQNQIDILNNDFNATNSDINLWTPAVSAFYPGTNVGSLNVQFVLATQNHPANTGLINGQVAVTFGTSFLGIDYDTKWKYYFNILVDDMLNGGGGISPQGGVPNSGCCIVMDQENFGSGTGCTGFVPSGAYNLGRILSHEAGHYFNLEHIFANNICNNTNNDYCADTPQCLVSTGCPVVGSVAGCITDQKSLTMNYMDYTEDACKFMFTANQATRMRAYYNVIVNQFATNVLSSEQFEFKDFTLFPNPNTGSFKISFNPETNDEINIIVNDLIGRNIYINAFQSIGIFEKEINIKNAQAGIYFVTILNGRYKKIEKIVIK